MKNIAFLLVLSISFISCMPDPEEPMSPVTHSNCTIEVKLKFCPTFDCVEFENFVGKEVQLYGSHNEAVDGVNPIHVDTTNQNGWVKFYDITCTQNANFNNSFIAVRIDLGVNGVFIGNANFFTTNQQFDVLVIPNYYYDYNQWHQPVVDKVSLEFPAVGQNSLFKYFQEPDAYNFEVAGSYNSDSYLQVYVTNQIGSNEFVMYEYLENPSAVYSSHLDNQSSQIYIESIWRFENDTLFVSNENPENGIISLIWNITEDEDLVNGEYAIPLITNSTNYLEMEGEFEMPAPEWTGVGGCSDFQISSFLFEDVLVEKRNYIDTGGPLKYIVFNKKEGILRSLNYSNATGEYTSGFDLQLL